MSSSVAAYHILLVLASLKYCSTTIQLPSTVAMIVICRIQKWQWEDTIKMDLREMNRRVIDCSKT
jgi:hypothetical protein